MTAAAAVAAGLNTNTNMNVVYDRMPARNAAIGIDGVYFNPAGVAFLDSGFHLSLGAQTVFQERIVETEFEPLKFGQKNNGSGSKEYLGEATAPIVPSMQAAYNWRDWSFQLGFGISSGGGKAVYDDGLGSFEGNVALLPLLLGEQLCITRYDVDTYMKGRQYGFGVQIGAARKFCDNLSAYAGLRVIYEDASYKGYLKNVKIGAGTSLLPVGDYFEGAIAKVSEQASQAEAAAAQYAAAGDEESAAKYEAAAAQAKAGVETLKATKGKMENATRDIELDCHQTGWGFMPIIGIDYKTGGLNLAAKYEFKTKMRLENDAKNSESAAAVESLNKYADGEKVAEDIPALLSLGAQYSFNSKLRAGIGYHLYFDKDATQYGHRERLINKNTWEGMLGVEYDVNDWLTASLGGWTTQIEADKDWYTDTNFNVDSYSLGLGVGIHVTKRVQLNLAYSYSWYVDYERETDDYNNLSRIVGAVAGKETAEGVVKSGALKARETFTRNNQIIGLGVNIDF